MMFFYPILSCLRYFEYVTATYINKNKLETMNHIRLLPTCV